MSDICQNIENISLKILAIKRWFLVNFVKLLLGRHFVVGGPKTFKLLHTFLSGAAIKILYCQVYYCFCVLDIKLI